jgi:cell wall-associated NlpC family hydrolase
VIGSSKKRPALWFLLAAAAALAVVAAGLSSPSGLRSKRAEAEQVLAQIQQIDSKLDKAVDAYNGATEKLRAIQAELRAARRHLSVARESSRRAQKALADRVVALYVNGDGESTLEIILGATSIDDLLDRIDAARRVSDQDARILTEVKATRRATAREERRLEKALAEQRRVVAARAATRREIEAQLIERQRLYDSIREEIARLEAEERERQRRLREEARTLAAQTEIGGVADTASASSIAAPPSRYGGVVGIAMQYLGIPYRWGGASPSTGFDCSGFVMHVYSQVGVYLPHNSAAQYGYGVPVSRDQLQAGDLVFFDGLGHNGIYIGDGLFIHSPHTGDVVKISSIYDSWYAATWVGARRIL